VTEIGKPERIIVVEPIEEPVPSKEPRPEPVPEQEPVEPEKVPA
jgi:hypothetical protein